MTKVHRAIAERLDWASSRSDVGAIKSAAKGLLPEIRSDRRRGELLAIAWLREMTTRLGNQFVVFFDSVENLGALGLSRFLENLASALGDGEKTRLPSSFALIGQLSPIMRRLRAFGYSASPFSVLTVPLTMRDFSQNEIEAIYSQHMEAARQRFD